MTCDLLSILPSAPPRPGTQQVARELPRQLQLQEANVVPNQGKENKVGCGLFALLFLPLGLPHRSDPLAASLRARAPGR